MQEMGSRPEACGSPLPNVSDCSLAITPNSRLRAESLAMAGTLQGNSRVVLRVAFKGIEEGHSFLEIDAWMPSEVKAISSLVDRLMQPIEGSHCVAGDELILFPSPNAMVTKLGKVLFPKCSQLLA